MVTASFVRMRQDDKLRGPSTDTELIGTRTRRCLLSCSCGDARDLIDCVEDDVELAAGAPRAVAREDEVIDADVGEGCGAVGQPTRSFVIADACAEGDLDVGAVASRVVAGASKHTELVAEGCVAVGDVE